LHDNRGDQRSFQYVDYETGTFLWNRANTVGPSRQSIDECRMRQLCEVYSTPWSSRVVENVRYVKKMVEFAESHQTDLRLFASPSDHEFRLDRSHGAWHSLRTLAPRTC